MTFQNPDNHPIIHQLPNFLIDQIKAGEVVERPSQAIKEIVENSIDAESTRIEIEIRDNGLELISISDNGIGIDFDQLPIAFKRHATSKINRYEDLFNLDTFGFRGEALASVAAISRLSCFSKPRHKEGIGGKIVYAGGQQVEYFENQALPEGTTLSIENLFYNTPARLKFIRSKQSEKNAINKILYSFLFSNFRISFSLKWDDQEAKVYPACKTEKERVEQIFSRKKNNEVIDFKIEHENYHVHGYFSTEGNKGTQGKLQYLFINNRYFQDKSLHQVILRSLEYIWGAGHSGHYCIFIKAPKDQVDVNVHPSKTFIKFQNPPLIHSLVGAGLKQNKRERETFSSNESEQTSSTELTRPQFHSPTFTSSPEQAAMSTMPSSGELFFLGDGFLLFKRDEKNYILNLTKLLDRFFSKKVNTKENKPQALLVAIPINISNKVILKKLNENGFHIETFSNVDQSEKYLCRAVPQWLLELGTNSFLQLFVLYLSNSLTLDEQTQRSLNKTHLLKILEHEDNVSTSILKEITQEMIHQWLV